MALSPWATLSLTCSRRCYRNVNYNRFKEHLVQSYIKASIEYRILVCLPVSSDCERDHRPLRWRVSEPHQIHPVRTPSPHGPPSCVSSGPLSAARPGSTCPGRHYISRHHAASLYLLQQHTTHERKPSPALRTSFHLKTSMCQWFFADDVTVLYAELPTYHSD